MTIKIVGKYNFVYAEKSHRLNAVQVEGSEGNLGPGFYIQSKGGIIHRTYDSMFGLEHSMVLRTEQNMFRTDKAFERKKAEINKTLEDIQEKKEILWEKGVEAFRMSD